MALVRGLLALTAWGVVLVVSTACGTDHGSPAAEAVRLAAVEVGASEPDLDLTLIHDLVVDSEGRTYVVGHAEQVTVLDGGARHVRTIGRQGAGPGEFIGIGSIDLTAGDTLLVYDLQLDRVTLFAPGSDKPARSVQLRPAFPMFPFTLKGIDGGRLLAHYRVAYGDGTGRENGREKHEMLRLLGADGALLRDSAVLLRERRHVEVPDGRGTSVFFNPLSPRSIVRTAGPGRFVTAWSDSLRFSVYSSDGELLRTIEPQHPGERHPITPRDRDSLAADWADGRPLEPAIRRAIDRLGFTTWPLLHDFTVDDRGWIWYALHPPREAREVEWVAVDERGAARERLALPTGSRLWTVRGRTAYVSETDSLDVPRVVIYALRSAPAGGAR